LTGEVEAIKVCVRKGGQRLRRRLSKKANVCKRKRGAKQKNGKGLGDVKGCTETAKGEIGD